MAKNKIKTRIILVEGPDQIGKDTQISLFVDKICDRPTHVIHVKPPKRFNNDIQPYLNDYFLDMFDMMREADIADRNLIFNRSHIGDFIYGHMYRKYDVNYIYEIEKIWKDYDFFNNIYLMTFINKPEVLVSREDGDSHSADLKDKKEEIKRFIKATKKSIIKHKIVIDCYEKLPAQVHQEVCGFLKDII